MENHTTLEIHNDKWLAFFHCHVSKKAYRSATHCSVKIAYYFLGRVGLGVVPLGSHEKNICVWTILVRIFGPSSRNNHPKLLFFFRFGRCIFCLQPRPTSFKKNITNHLIKLTFQNGAFFPGKFRRWSLTTPLQRRVSPPNALVGSIWWMPNYTPVEHAKFSIWNTSDMFLDVFLDVGGSVYH